MSRWNLHLSPRYGQQPLSHNHARYDQKNRLTNLAVNGSSGPIKSYAYTLDSAGHRTSVAELSGRTVNYGYDNIYRLTSEAIANDAAGNNGTVNYTYDPVGNRTQMTSSLAAVPPGSFGYDADDRLALDTYDANGNTIGSGGLNYVYDFENHLIQQGGATFVYDGDGNRVQKTVAGVTTKYLVSEVNPTGYPQVLSESFSGGTGARELYRNFVYGLDRISQYRSYFTGTQSLTQTSYYVYDGHGSVRALTDSSGNITDTYDYDAFGNLIHSTGTTPNEFLFAGEQFDSNLNLYYNRARYLNTTTGRFWTVDRVDGDPLSPLSLHRYLYVSADPINGLDPTGNQDDVEEAAAEGIGEELDSNIGADAGRIGEAVENLAGEAEVDVAESAAPAQEGETVQEAEEAQAESTVRQELKITDERLGHITERHFPGGSESEGKSLFNAGEDIRSLVQAGENVNPVQQVGGNFQRVIDAGREIGFSRATGPTSIYTLITNPAGEIVTAFPGLPGE